MSEINNDFGKIRTILWPIYNHELKKIIPMILMFSCVIFNYTILRDIKDTLVVTASGGGAEVIPFLKLWGVLPAAITVMLIYAKLSNVFSKQTLFYISLLPFLIFFALFPLVIYPYKEHLHPHKFCDMLTTYLPLGFYGLIGAIRNWTYSLFYIFAELWGSVALSFLCWGFANDITKVSESKRFYALIGLLVNFAIISSGYLVKWVSEVRLNSTDNIDPWQISLNYLMLASFISVLCIMAIYWWSSKNIIAPSRSDNNIKIKKNKPKLSMTDSIKKIVSSKYLGCVAILVISYGLSINLVEIVWKNQLKLQYPDPNSYSVFMGEFSLYTGLFALVMMMAFGCNLLRKLSWKSSAIITPVILLITGSIFFSVIIFKNQLAGIVSFLGTTPLMIGVMFGATQNIMTKACKYSFFDPTKEMAYIPLTEEEKSTGKAAVDIVAARLGKSGGAFIQQFIILWLGSLASITPYVAIFLLVIIAGWMFAVSSLNKKFIARLKQQTVKKSYEYTTERHEYQSKETQDKQKNIPANIETAQSMT